MGSRLPHCRDVQWQGGFSRDLDPEPDRASDRLDWPAKSPGPEALEPEHTPEHAAADDDSEEGEPFLVSGGKGECGLFGPDKSPLIVQPIEETDDRGSVEARVPFRVLRREGVKLLIRRLLRDGLGSTLFPYKFLLPVLLTLVF